MKWSEAVTLQFVKIYLKKECLWNPAHLGYKLKNQREKSYSEIASEFRASTSKTLTVPEVKTKIKNLRTTYTEQVNKIIQRSNPDNIYEPSLIWFHEMDKYLKHIPNKRQQSHNNTQDISEVDSSCRMWIDLETSNVNVDECNPDPLIGKGDKKHNDNRPRHGLIKDKPCSIIHKKRKNKKFKPKIPVQDYSTDSTTEGTVTEDEFDIYGKFIASQLRAMELQKALRLQLAIQNLVSEARISDINND